MTAPTGLAHGPPAREHGGGRREAPREDRVLEGDGEFASFDGVRIAYRVMGAASPLPFPVLLHHGFGSDLETNWVRPGVAGAVVRAGHDVVLVDARGHGRSEKPHDRAAYGDSAMERDVEALGDHLSLSAFDLVGYSMGAFVAMAFASSGSGRARVRRLVLGGAGAAQASIADAARAERIARALETDDPSSIEDRTARAFRSFADATGADRLALAALQRARSRLPDRKALGRIRTPTLVVVGERDTLVGSAGALAGAIPGARLVVVPGDHISAPVKPEFAQAIVEFLGEPL